MGICLMDIYALFTCRQVTFMHRLSEIGYTIAIDMRGGAAGLLLERSTMTMTKTVE